MKEGRAARNSSSLLQGLLDFLVLATGVLVGFQQTASHEQVKRLELAVESLYRGIAPVLLGRPLDMMQPVQPLAFVVGILLVGMSVRAGFGTSRVQGLPDLEAI